MELTAGLTLAFHYVWFVEMGAWALPQIATDVAETSLLEKFANLFHKVKFRQQIFHLIIFVGDTLYCIWLAPKGTWTFRTLFMCKTHIS